MLQVFKYAEEIGERKGLEKGIAIGKKEGLKETIRTLLEVKFKEKGEVLFCEIDRITDLEQLITLKGLLKYTNDLNQVKSFLAQLPKAQESQK